MAIPRIELVMQHGWLPRCPYSTGSPTATESESWIKPPPPECGAQQNRPAIQSELKHMGRQRNRCPHPPEPGVGITHRNREGLIRDIVRFFGTPLDHKTASLPSRKRPDVCRQTPQ